MTEQLNIDNGLRIHDAVKQAMLRKVERLAKMRDELDELQWLSFISPSDLMLLEDHGFLLDFDTGLCVDTWHAIDVQAEVVHASAETMQ